MDSFMSLVVKVLICFITDSLLTIFENVTFIIVVYYIIDFNFVKGFL